MSLDIIDADRAHRVADLEAHALTLPQVDCPVTNYFGPGIYVREITAPADTVIIGHHHKGPCMNVLVKGSMRIIGPDGVPSVITAPLMFNTGPGRKVAYVIDDVVFQNIWATDETDLDKLESLLIEKSAAWLDHDAQTQLAMLAPEVKE